MARTRTARPTIAPVVASAARVSVRKNSKIAKALKGGDGWQEACWEFYNTIGEFHSAVTWVGNVLSRAKLYATYDDGTGPKRVEDTHEAAKVLAEFFGGQQGQGQALREYGINYSVAGEAYTVGYDEDDTTIWGVYSPQEVKQVGDSYRIGDLTLPEDAVIIRSWRAHPRRKKRPDSPARSAVPVLAEISALDQHTRAQIDSRLAGAGVLLLPNEIAVASTTVQNENGDKQVVSSAQEFVNNLSDAMARSINDRDDPSALVPITVTADGEHLDKVQHLTFWTELDDKVIAMRAEAIRRLGLALDMPPEILTGMGDASHWSAWAVDESSIKAHTEPLLFQITLDLTIGFLRPALEGLVDDPSAYGIAADTSEMRLRPNRSQEALELYDRGELSGKALRRETGFDEDDKPSADEYQIWLLRKMASGSTTPEIVVEAARKLGVDLPPVVDTTAPATEERPTPSLEDHPSQDPPEDLVAAAEQMAHRALERAGNRLRSRARGAGAQCPDVDAVDLYQYMPTDSKSIEFALEDAWTSIPRYAKQYGMAPAPLATALNAYCSLLMAERKAPDRDLLRAHLRTAR